MKAHIIALQTDPFFADKIAVIWQHLSEKHRVSLTAFMKWSAICPISTLIISCLLELVLRHRRIPIPEDLGLVVELGLDLRLWVALVSKEWVLCVRQLLYRLAHCARGPHILVVAHIEAGLVLSWFAFFITRARQILICSVWGTFWTASATCVLN